MRARFYFRCAMWFMKRLFPVMAMKTNSDGNVEAVIFCINERIANMYMTRAELRENQP